MDNIDIEIPDNSIFGLAGTNGAGKSTFPASFIRCFETGSGEYYDSTVSLSTSRRR